MSNKASHSRGGESKERSAKDSSGIATTHWIGVRATVKRCAWLLFYSGFPSNYG